MEKIQKIDNLINEYSVKDIENINFEKKFYDNYSFILIKNKLLCDVNRQLNYSGYCFSINSNSYVRNLRIKVLDENINIINKINVVDFIYSE